MGGFHNYIIYLALIFLVSCVGSGPQARILDVRQSTVLSSNQKKRVTVTVEVFNPTGRDLEVRQIKYQAGQNTGTKQVTRSISANGTRILEFSWLQDPANAIGDIAGNLILRDHRAERVVPFKKSAQKPR